MKRLLLATLILLAPAAFAQTSTTNCSANCTVSAGSVTVNWEAVTTYTTGAAIPAGTAVTYNVYGSQGCGTKTLQASTGNLSAVVTVAAGCYSIAVSAVVAGVEGAVSSPSLTLTVNAAPLAPATPQSVTVQVPSSGT